MNSVPSFEGSSSRNPSRARLSDPARLIAAISFTISGAVAPTTTTLFALISGSPRQQRVRRALGEAHARSRPSPGTHAGSRRPFSPACDVLSKVLLLYFPSRSPGLDY